MGSALRQEQTTQDQGHIGKLLSFQNKKSYYRKVYMNWDTIERANKNDNAVHRRTTLLCNHAKNIAGVAVGKLTKGHRIFFNHKYLSTITFCTRRQNLRLIDQLREIFEISYHNTVTHNGKKYRHCYEFAFKLEKPVNTPVAKSVTGTNKPPTNETLLIVKENKHIEDIDLISKFSNNSPMAKSIKKAVLMKKARIYRPLFSNQYPQTKNLAEHYPLTAADCSDLQSRSGRDFNLNSMNEILLALSNKPKESGHEFPSKEAFLAYMSKIYRYEKRDAVEISRLNYQIKANMTDSDRANQTTFAQREKFLDKVETEAIMNVNPNNQLKAKLANTLPPGVAYDFLSKLKHFRIDGRVLEAHLTSETELSSVSEQMILKEANAVGGDYSGVMKLKVLQIKY